MPTRSRTKTQTATDNEEKDDEVVVPLKSTFSDVDKNPSIVITHDVPGSIKKHKKLTL